MSLIRPYINPYDLLKHVERFTNREGFAENRYSAECNARFISSKEDITFDEIYNFVSEKYRDLKEIELNFEYKLLRPNNSVKAIYDLAKELNKQIYIISDMYLPKSFLEKVLAKNGYTEYKELYVSSEKRVAKYTGNLFKEFLKEQNLQPSSVLHIGDSKISDIKQPKKLGIHTYWIEKISDKFLLDKNNHRFFELYENNKSSLEISIILAELAEKFACDKTIFNSKANYWKNFGYFIAGSIAYSYARFLLRETYLNKYQELLFVARDGYLLKKVFDILKDYPIKTHYIYAQRILRARILLDYGDEHNADVLFNLIIERTGEKIKLNSFKEKEEFITSNLAVLKKSATEKKDDYKKYILDCGVDISQDIALVDTGAATFSAQQLVQTAIDKPVQGLYSIITNPLYAKEKQISYKTWARTPSDIVNITAFIEFCLTSPEPPIVDLANNKPVYMKNPSGEEIYRNSLYQPVENGVLEFTNNMKNKFAGLEVEFSAIEVNKYIQAFGCNLNRTDKKLLGTVYCSSNANHTEYKQNLLKEILNVCPQGKNRWFNRYFSIKKEYSKDITRIVIKIFSLKIKFKVIS